MKHVIIAGGTGMVGRIVLRECLNAPEIERVTSISRKPSGIRHTKLVEVIHHDFLNYAAIEKHFKDQDIAYFCIGVYTGTVPDDLFRIITVDYTKVFADALIRNSPGTTFCFLSGEGADRKEKSRMSFARYKGMAENYLISKGFVHLYLFRPSYIYPVQRRHEPNLVYRILRMMYPVLKLIFPGSAISSEQLGHAMFSAGISGADKMTLENQDIKGLI
jgi:uncharacterized protein YbjT (DUF2867 family)